jgi:hypothetical protein
MPVRLENIARVGLDYGCVFEVNSFELYSMPFGRGKNIYTHGYTAM